VLIAGVVIVSTPLVPYQWQLTGNAWAVIFPLTVVLGCHILFPVSIPFPRFNAIGLANRRISFRR
jgi:hypothetical protein